MAEHLQPQHEMSNRKQPRRTKSCSLELGNAMFVLAAASACVALMAVPSALFVHWGVWVLGIWLGSAITFLTTGILLRRRSRIGYFMLVAVGVAGVAVPLLGCVFEPADEDRIAQITFSILMAAFWTVILARVLRRDCRTEFFADRNPLPGGRQPVP